MAGVLHIPAKKFFIYNTIGGVIWTLGVTGLGFVLGNKLSGSVDKYLLPVVALIVVISFIPVAIELLREWRTKKDLS
jgi:membrane-associated protein